MLEASGKRAGRIFGVSNQNFAQAAQSPITSRPTLIGQWDERSGEQVAAIYRDIGAVVGLVATAR
jgi:hypothetical protein